MLVAKSLASFLSYFITIGLLTLTALPLSAASEDGAWGPMADLFFRPLTFNEADPNNFGQAQGKEDIELAKKFRPNVYIAPGGLKPIDFYKDYLPNTVLKDRSNGNEIVNPNPDRQALKRIERSFGKYLEYTGPPGLDGSPVAYSRVFRETVDIIRPAGPASIPFVFIKYNFTFLKSGLPARLPWYKSLFVSVAGDARRWHDLDIHGAIIVALTNVDGQLKPVALLLAQHNHFRTYLVGRDIGAPKDGRFAISFALRSNEPYPAPAGKIPVEYRAIGDPTDFAYVIEGNGFYFTAGHDVVYGPGAGAKRLAYTLQALPLRDPLYVAWISLGGMLKLFGLFETFYRDGPPGINMCTWPELRHYGDLMKFWFIDDGDQEAARLFTTHLGSFWDPTLGPILEYNEARFSVEFLKLYPDFK